jgi:hypothetical protein
MKTPMTWMSLALLAAAALSTAASAQAPPAATSAERSGPFAEVNWMTIRHLDTANETIVSIRTFRGMDGCGDDEFIAEQKDTQDVQKTGCFVIAESDRSRMTIRWQDGRVEVFRNADWIFEFGSYNPDIRTSRIEVYHPVHVSDHE